MRIVVDCRMAEWSGVGRYTRGLVRALSRRADLEIVQAIAPGAEPPTPAAERMTCAGHPLSPRGAYALGRAVAAVRPDITHCLHFPTPIPARRPLVVTLHDVSPLVVPGVMPSGRRRAVYRRMNARAISIADHIITVSAHSATDIERLFPRAAGKTTVTPLAADDFSAGPMGELPVQLRGARYVLSMGNTKTHKDLPALLRAFVRVAETHPDILLVLVGEESPGFVARVLGDSDVAARVRFTGPADDAALRALYAHAEMFAFPSRYEGFGLPPLEAMSFSTPVVTTTAASLPEVVGDAALRVAPGDEEALADAIVRIAGDAALRERLGQAGVRRAASFSWDRTAERTARVYAEVLGASSA